ncbi:hypothetical protein IX95_23915 [Vibrio sp. B183]|uniref:hypothetical protein n=1 Tax=Vibrio sp. B183 TaxID=1526762 RepID=UPI000505CB49|nr:hypothetical protein [Vibrio sp. B183]KFI09522.1 hypothetical protein IX95_23915 [Vibrio sp. B183]
MNYDPLQHNEQQKKKRQERPLCRLHYSVMMRILNNPSSSAAFLTENGRASQQSMVNDVARFMYVLVNEMCLTTGKIGVDTQHGFLLRTWGYIGKELNMPEWRVKQCKDYAIRKGWITSVQPRERYTCKDNLEKWRGLASIKKITDKYFADLGMLKERLEAKQKARKYLKKRATQWQRPIKYILTPITLLARRRKERLLATSQVLQATEAPPIPI